MYEERAYREYVCESLRLRGENKVLAKPWGDIIRKDRHDSRSPEEIAEDVIARAGLTRKGSEE